MKKLGLITAVLMVVAAPALATVNITCTADGNMVTVSYAVVSEPNKVRAFGLDIMVDSPAKINDVNNLNPKYWVYPGSIVIVNGEVNDVGTPVANPYDPCTLPGQTQPGLNSGGITIEMGSLYYPTGDNSPNAPGTSGTLLRFKVCHVFEGCKVTIRENVIRGGVVLTNPALDPVVNSPGYTFVLLPQVPVLSGTVTLQNLTAGKEVGKTVTVQIYNGATLVETLSPVLAAGGTYTATCVTTTPGTYDIKFKASHWLRKKLAGVVLVAGSNALATPSLLNGDINGSNVIDVTDFGLLRTNFLKTGVGLAGDLNEDNVVDVTDFGILRTNFLKAGD
jgi:hypothetical protein